MPLQWRNQLWQTVLEEGAGFNNVGYSAEGTLNSVAAKFHRKGWGLVAMFFKGTETLQLSQFLSGILSQFPSGIILM